MTLQVTPFIMLDGKAEEAIRFYEQALGAKVVFKQLFGQAPETPGQPMLEEVKSRVAHSVLKIGDAELFVADGYPGEFGQRGDQLSICITSGDVETSKRLFEALQQDGEVKMPLEEIYFSPAYGMVTDKFGVTFQIFTKRP